MFIFKNLNRLLVDYNVVNYLIANLFEHGLHVICNNNIVLNDKYFYGVFQIIKVLMVTIQNYKKLLTAIINSKASKKVANASFFNSGSSFEGSSVLNTFLR